MSARAAGEAGGFVMLPALTPAVARALEAARQHARGQDSPEVLPAHLLYALLDEEEGAAASLARRAGLDPAAYLAGRPAPPAFEPDRRPLSADAESLLYHARELAAELTGDSDV